MIERTSSIKKDDTSSAKKDDESDSAQIKTEDHEFDLNQVQQEAETQENQPPSGTSLNVATPWKISAIEEGLGGKHDRETIVEMLRQCRGNIERAFTNLLDGSRGSPQDQASESDTTDKSRPSSSVSAGTKRAVEDDDSDSDEEPQSAIRCRFPRQRILPDVTVGIAFRDEQNDLVSLRLRVEPDSAAEGASSGPEAGCKSSAPASDSEVPAKKRTKRRGRRYGRPRRLE